MAISDGLGFDPCAQTLRPEATPEANWLLFGDPTNASSSNDDNPKSCLSSRLILVNDSLRFKLFAVIITNYKINWVCIILGREPRRMQKPQACTKSDK